LRTHKKLPEYIAIHDEEAGEDALRFFVGSQSTDDLFFDKRTGTSGTNCPSRRRNQVFVSVGSHWKNLVSLLLSQL
jgi:hypothetical protein